MPQMSTAGNYSSSSMDPLSGREMSPMSIDNASPRYTADYITIPGTIVLGLPQIKILVQPVDKLRFRYKPEMLETLGSLLGEKDDLRQKEEGPTVELINYFGSAVIRCSLVTSEYENRMPHAHHLVKREGNQELHDFHEVEVSEEDGYVAAFCGMGIMHTAEKNIKNDLVRKKKKEALEKSMQKNVNVRTLGVTDLKKINQEDEEAAKTMNLNSVALCFQAFCRDSNGILQVLSDPVYSHPINNLKSALRGELKISRISKQTSNCEGNDEVFILVENVGKRNMKVKFYELDDSNNEIWCDYGKFSELDVHNDSAIVLLIFTFLGTPAYKDARITSQKDVYIKLERPFDGECSNGVKFTYNASEKLNQVLPSQAVNENISCQTSTEDLVRIIYSNASLSSEELKTAIEDIEVKKFLDSYKNLMENDSEKNVCDGPTEHANFTFAKEPLAEILEFIKNKNHGETPLHAALRYNQPVTTKSLIMILGFHPYFKALVNTKDSLGKTPLQYAVTQNQTDVVKALLFFGANP